MKRWTSNEIAEDFNFFIKKLDKIHPNPYRFISKKSLEKRLSKLLSKYEMIDHSTFIFELMKIFSEMGDSHTRIRGFDKLLSQKEYPFRVTLLNDTYYIVAVDYKHQKYIGSKILSLNGISIKDIVSKMSAVITHENEVVLSNGVQAWISDLDLLKYLDIVKEDFILNIETDKGKLKLKPIKIFEDELCNPRKDSIQKSETLNPKGLYWKKYYKELDTYYLQYNECEDITKKEILGIVDEIRKYQVKFVVTDLRNNPGGSSLILDPFTDFLFENQDRIIPIVFISNNTFSAAIINALNILDCKNSISIGKKTAGAPTKFGQTIDIFLPNSKIVLSVSTKYFEEKGYDFGCPLVPKIEVKESIHEYLEGIDVDWREFLKQRKHLI